MCAGSGPGHMFSIGDGYHNFIRLNYSYAWSPEIEKALVTLGKLAASCLREETAAARPPKR